MILLNVCVTATFIFYVNMHTFGTKTSRYPEAHPLSQCPLVELQETFFKQFPLQWLIQSVPNIPCSQPVVKIF